MDERKRILRRAVFLDQNQYITAWEQVEFLPGVGEALRELKQNGFLLIIVTNQSAVSRNELAVEVLESIHKRMLHRLAQQSATIDAIYYCPHDRNGNCQCRKPRPQMLLQAAQEHGIDLQQSWMVGDAPSDIEAGRTAGCRTVWLRPGGFNGENPPPAEFITTSIREAAGWILNADPLLNKGTIAEAL